VIAILDVLAPRPGDVAVSWLPLSHDMGLIGMLLTSLVAGSPRWVGEGELVLVRPEEFLADPSSWLRTCAAAQATITAGPTFGYGLASRAASRLPEGSLRCMRAAIVGAEPIPAAALHSFGAAVRHTGWHDTAFCPAYGMAEAALAVSITRPADRWESARVDVAELWSGTWRPDDNGFEIVNSGAPLPGCTVSTSDTGEIFVDTPSLFAGYVGEPAATRPHATGDIGALVDGNVFVAGRRDDIIVTRGRQFHSRELELAAEAVSGIRRGACLAAADPGGGFVVLAELAAANVDRTATAHHVRASLAKQCGVTPNRVLFLERGSIPKTASGKPRRHLVTAALATGRVPVIAGYE
jgi:acyl-CoA synthetase (AMP-forming)/AMP-acid ligase II